MDSHHNKPTFPRSPHWGAVRSAHLKAEPVCQACGAKTGLEVHHVKPYHLFPDLELAQENLLTLCEGACNCHLTWGHLHLWAAYNPGVRADVAAYREKVHMRLTA